MSTAYEIATAKEKLESLKAARSTIETQLANIYISEQVWAALDSAHMLLNEAVLDARADLARLQNLAEQSA